jgi:hypothetical protein
MDIGSSRIHTNRVVRRDVGRILVYIVEYGVHSNLELGLQQAPSIPETALRLARRIDGITVRSSSNYGRLIVVS